MSDQTFVVRQLGQAIRFETFTGFKRIYKAVADHEATQFDKAWEAELKAKEFGMREGTFAVTPLIQ